MKKVFVCSGTECNAEDNTKIRETIEAEIKALGLKNITVETAGCLDVCKQGPVVAIEPDGVLYSDLSPIDAVEIVHSHLLNNQLVLRKIVNEEDRRQPETENTAFTTDSIPSEEYEKIALNAGMMQKLEEAKQLLAEKKLCGKCAPCRLGTPQILYILDRITKGEGAAGDLDLLDELCETVKKGSLCGLGRKAADPIIQTLLQVQGESQNSIAADIAADISKFVVKTEECIGCHRCTKNCPTGAISGEIKQPHTIDQENCTQCGQCFEGCPVKDKAIAKVTDTVDAEGV